MNKIRKNIGIFALAVTTFGSTTFGQLTITLPNFPKIKKTRPDTSKVNTIIDTNQPDNVQLEQTNSQTSANSCSGDIVMDVYLKDIETTRKQAAEYVPGIRDYYVQDYSDRENKYLKASLSQSRRQEWMKNWPAKFVQCINPALDGLAAVAKQTLPKYMPTGYNIRNAAEEKVMRAAVNDISQATVFKVGVDSAAWKIGKDNYNFPTNRYKYGIIWAKYPSLDDGFCRIIYVNVVQDYAGGGTYGASYGNFIKSEYAGCPPGK
ncbi:MAG TPA: hypothetical protein VJL58_00175 [Pyrinomonadaceae bacterium]|nr:hypothetical protein [Pyrinomonadaceae bacterium]